MYECVTVRPRWSISSKSVYAQPTSGALRNARTRRSRCRGCHSSSWSRNASSSPVARAAAALRAADWPPFGWRTTLIGTGESNASATRRGVVRRAVVHHDDLVRAAASWPTIERSAASMYAAPLYTGTMAVTVGPGRCGRGRPGRGWLGHGDLRDDAVGSGRTAARVRRWGSGVPARRCSSSSSGQSIIDALSSTLRAAIQALACPPVLGMVIEADRQLLAGTTVADASRPDSTCSNPVAGPNSWRRPSSDIRQKSFGWACVGHVHGHDVRR